MRIEALRQTAGDASTAAPLDALASLVEQAAESAGSLVIELSPPILRELGIAAALGWMCERFEQQHRVEFRFSGSDEAGAGVADEVGTILFQVARELALNAVKHSGANRVDVSLVRDGGTVTITVADNGKGFHVSSVAALPSDNRGFGLFSIRERLSALGGMLKIESKPGRGTRAELIVPVAAGCAQ